MILQACFYFKKSSKAYGNLKQFKRSTPDLDNLMKTLLDGLKGVIYIDDASVVCFRDVRKYDAHKDQVKIDLSWHAVDSRNTCLTKSSSSKSCLDGPLLKRKRKRKRVDDAKTLGLKG